jgi:methylisocitrate lyase
MRGKSVVPAEEHAQKIRAAVEAKGDKPFLITARTDARGPLGLDEAIRRGKLYQEAGANIIFIEAPESLEEMKRITQEVPGLLVSNMIEGGKTPILSLEQLQEMGFHTVGFVLTGLFAAARAMSDTYAHLLEHGSSLGISDKLMSFEEFTSVVGLEERYALDERFKI